MKANWNGRHLRLDRLRRLPLHHPHATSGGRRHGPIGDAKGFEALGIAQQIDPLLDALRGDLCTVEQLARCFSCGEEATCGAFRCSAIQAVYCVTKLPSAALAALPSLSWRGRPSTVRCL